MAQDYKGYLAANVLSEERVITYRLLSRALKVNVNKAKEMLFDFHHIQNGKKPNTVHATYLISGHKRTEALVPANGDPAKDGDDDYMQSSPFVSSSMPQQEESYTRILSITLAREEDLEKVQSEYENITSIHIYSLEAQPLKDLQILADADREVVSLSANEDPLESGKIYGSITNKDVRRRQGRRPPPPPAATSAPSATKATQIKQQIQEKKEQSKTSAAADKPEPSTSQSKSAKDFFSKSNDKGSKPPPPPLKRDSSSIFKSFAKAKPKAKVESTDNPTGTAGSDTPASKEVKDEVMGGMSEDEDDGNYVPHAEDTGAGSKGPSRKEREEALKKMMEDSDGDDNDDEKEKAPTEATESVDVPEVKEEQAQAEEKDDGAAADDSAGDQPADDTSAKVSAPGRRRGKRRVMKKKTIKDEEGYLVTKEEPAWESFSEDEPVAPKAKLQSFSASSTASAKQKKPAGKAGQGNIMSFFGKK